MRSLLGWIGRKTGIYLLLVLLLLIIAASGPMVKQSWEAQQRSAALNQISKQIRSEKAELSRKLRSEGVKIGAASAEQLQAQYIDLRTKGLALRQNINAAKPAWILAVTDQQALLQTERQKLQLAWVEQQMEAIEAARQILESQTLATSATQHRTAQIALVEAHRANCVAATHSLQQYEDRWEWRVRQWFDSPAHQDLVAKRHKHCEDYQGASRVLRHMTAANRLSAQAETASKAAYARVISQADRLERAGEHLAADADRAQKILSGTAAQKLSLWAERVGLRQIIWQAAALLAIIIGAPFLVRFISFYIFAPLVMRRPSIRLNIAPIPQRPIFTQPQSSISLSILLKEDQELLVRQNYLQSSSQNSDKSTLWLLDKQHPFTSMAAGLSFLTRIRGAGETTTLSAVHDGLSEVAMLSLPVGAACVLQPRALAAVIQPIGRPLRITSHWRIFSLSAWLTMQLRYLVFHGPAELVVTGGRGVRAEDAKAGRIFGQDQLVGFSADLAYSVTRTETFWPYFLGREPLLKDRVLAGEGLLIIEEAPQSSRHGKPRRGFEAVVDAILKIFGL